MNSIFLKLKNKNIYLLLTIILQIFFIYSLYQSSYFFIEVLSTKKIVGLIFFQFLILFIFFSIFYEKFYFLSSFIFSLILINFLTTPFFSYSQVFFSLQPRFITLQPNLNKKIVINNNVMPGFTGISNISTDSLGFRTTKKINYKFKDKDIYRVFMIGGSTTEQIYLDDKKTSAALLENFLELGNKSKKIEVINTGVSGLRAEHHYATFEQILKYSPDLVIFMMGINDMYSDIKEFVKNNEKKEEGNLARFDFSKSILWKTCKNLLDIILFSYKKKDANLFNSIQYNSIEYVDGSYYSKQNNSLAKKNKKKVNIEKISDHYQFWLDHIIKLCNLKKKTTKCLIVNQASAYKNDVSENLQKLFWMTPPNQNYTLQLDNLIKLMKLYNNYLISYSDKNKINNCDISNSLPPSTEYFYDDNHFNESGAKLAAQKIFKCINLTKY
jgi:lysophospholipase L1-like esterase